jgi:acyl-CoA synthetase
LGQVVRARALESPDTIAFSTPTDRVSWADYDRLADGIASQLAALGFAAPDRVGVLLPDGPIVHAVYLGAERAGIVVVGIGARAGDAEISHLVRTTGARGLISPRQHRDVDMVNRVRGLLEDEDGPSPLHLVVDGEGRLRPATRIAGRLAVAARDEPVAHERSIGANELWIVNSTSGTTGLPKCVTQFQNRWMFFHQLAQRAGALVPDDVFLSVVPAPFGFGIWTQHVTPTLLGAPTALLPSFSAAEAIATIERERVTVLCCVSTQFLMMLNHASVADHDLSSLRVMFTGGEAVPFARAAEFEDRTGAKVLQFFGSNETGALSCTTLTDDRDRRLRTAGKVIPEMNVRLFDDEGRDITDTGGPGQPGGRGAATCAGYLDAAGNDQLFTSDGWMLMADIVTIDDEGYLEVVGRKSDLIIRGGKNISARQVEDEVATFPGVRLVAAVPVPDPVYGERTGVAIVTDRIDVTVEALADHLSKRGLSPELFPEHVVVLDELPIASGGKVSKAETRRIVLEHLGMSDSAHSGGK